MKLFFQVLFLLSVGTLQADCTEADCGPPLGMPNYLCADGETVAGPGDCIETANGGCAWEIVSCPQLTGYLIPIVVSFCMDACAYFYLESELGDFYTNITDLDNIESLSYFNHRYVTLSGEDVWCVECGAVDVSEITVSGNCEMPVDCFQNPCIDASCPAYPNAECVSTYCGGCHADFYQNGELITDCDYSNGCTDLTGISFGTCDMVIGIGYSNGSCNYISGCGWVVGGVDYSDAFFDTIEECEAACFDDQLTCDEIPAEYELLHIGEFATCEYDMDCIAVWGDCGVGLGGCHYSVNVELYPEDEIHELVNIWYEEGCMEGVCDCIGPPYAQCVNNVCTSAYCMGENPAGCLQTGCPDGFECEVNENDCIPSFCSCEGDFYGSWTCTEDCGGGVCVESSLLGDLNGDGVINVVDIVLAVDAILNTEFNPLGDMNGDGSLNVVDIILMVNHVFGFEAQ